MNGLPENLIKKLQRVQNTAAKLVFNLRKYDRITPALVTLHWLPVKYRIEFKTLLIVFKGLHGKAPTYIQEMITPSKSKRYSIRSNEERVLKVPKFKHDTFGKRAFAVYGPLAWNCLPKEIRLCDEIEAFKRNLKTHLFVKFVNESTLAIWFWRIIVKRPRMLSAQFVALYKPCKPKPCKPKPINILYVSKRGSTEDNFHTISVVLGWGCSRSQQRNNQSPVLSIRTGGARQNERQFPDDISKCIFLNESIWILIKISLKFIPKGQINNIPSLIQIMACRLVGAKPLSEPMMVSLLTHISVIRPQWVHTGNRHGISSSCKITLAEITTLT